jgi:predicted ATPase
VRSRLVHAPGGEEVERGENDEHAQEDEEQEEGQLQRFFHLCRAYHGKPRFEKAAARKTPQKPGTKALDQDGQFFLNWLDAFALFASRQYALRRMLVQ